MKKDTLAINSRLVSVNFEHKHQFDLSVPVLSSSLKWPFLEIILAQPTQKHKNHFLFKIRNVFEDTFSLYIIDFGYG